MSTLLLILVVIYITFNELRTYNLNKKNKAIKNDIENILDCCNLHYWNSDMDDSDDLFLKYEKKTNTKKDQGTSL